MGFIDLCQDDNCESDHPYLVNHVPMIKCPFFVSIIRLQKGISIFNCYFPNRIEETDLMQNNVSGIC